jgi:hypothetical protein
MNYVEQNDGYKLRYVGAKVGAKMVTSLNKFGGDKVFQRITATIGT